MVRRSKASSVGEIAEALRAHGFEVTEALDGLRVNKYGCAAVLYPHAGTTMDTAGTVLAYRERPGAWIAGEIARLLDRGYQKFLQVNRYELPATAEQLRSIHQFTEELTLVTGGISLYNESLGTTSDVYQYDRVKGREVSAGAATRPWELTESH
uniref:Uncharacterized protein n=1 Tax=mine drainage metagenome TaxID=410659 RepID=E6PYT1_9ZZZZ